MVLRDMAPEPVVEPPDMLEQAERSATIAAMAVSLNMAVGPWVPPGIRRLWIGTGRKRVPALDTQTGRIRFVGQRAVPASAPPL